MVGLKILPLLGNNGGGHRWGRLRTYLAVVSHDTIGVAPTYDDPPRVGGT